MLERSRSRLVDRRLGDVAAPLLEQRIGGEEPGSLQAVLGEELFELGDRGRPLARRAVVGREERLVAREHEAAQAGLGFEEVEAQLADGLDHAIDPLQLGLTDDRRAQPAEDDARRERREGEGHADREQQPMGEAPRQQTFESGALVAPGGFVGEPAGRAGERAAGDGVWGAHDGLG